MNEAFSRGTSYVRSLRAKSLKERLFGNPYYNKTTTFIKSRPMTSFIVSLVILFGIIALASFLSKKPVEQKAEDRSTKAVTTYKLGSAPKVSLQAQVKKNGVIQIIAQTAGVVQKVPVSAGDSVKRGTQLVQLSSNYQGDNAAAIQTSIAQTQYKNVTDTYQTQKDLIAKQREVAQKSQENTTELQNISRDSIDETRNLLDLNKQIVSTVIQNTRALEANNPNGVNDATILQSRQIQSQVQAGINQLESGVANLEYQTNTGNPPTELANLQKDIALKGLDVQEKALEMQKKISGLQVSLAAVGESLMYPASPCAGTVERISVTVGELVSPGTVIAVIKGSNNTIQLTASAPQHIAQSVSKMTPSTIHIQNTTLSLTPTYISTEATNGQLYTIEYNLPAEYSSTVTDSEFVTVDMPLTTEQSLSKTPYIPIDAVFQTQQEAYVNVVENGVAQVRKLSLGNVYGEYVEVISGINFGDTVILDRNVLAGDRVSSK